MSVPQGLNFYDAAETPGQQADSTSSLPPNGQLCYRPCRSPGVKELHTLVSIICHLVNGGCLLSCSYHSNGSDCFVLALSRRTKLHKDHIGVVLSWSHLAIEGFIHSSLGMMSL